MRFEEDNWESPTLGAWGVGWQVLIDGMEITQFTYFQQAGGIDLAPISAEITYGLERIAMFLSKAKLGLRRDVERHGLTYGEVRQRDEVELSKYDFEVADAELATLMLDRLEARGAALPRGRASCFPAYEATLVCSHQFNILDARGAVSATDRVGDHPADPRARLRLRAGLRCGTGGQGFPLAEPEPAAV